MNTDRGDVGMQETTPLRTNKTVAANIKWVIAKSNNFGEKDEPRKERAGRF